LEGHKHDIQDEEDEGDLKFGGFRATANYIVVTF